MRDTGAVKRRQSSVERERDFLQYFTRQEPKRRRKIIEHLQRPQLNCISEIFSNFLKCNLTKKPQVIARLRKHKRDIHRISLKKTPLREKRAILRSRRGGNILNVLLPIASALLSTVL